MTDTRDSLQSVIAEMRRKAKNYGLTATAIELKEFADRLTDLQSGAGDAQDAARYQFLRSNNWNESAIFVVAGSKECVRLGTDCPSRERLDEAIDNAIATQGHDMGVL